MLCSRKPAPPVRLYARWGMRRRNGFCRPRLRVHRGEVTPDGPATLAGAFGELSMEKHRGRPLFLWTPHSGFNCHLAEGISTTRWSGGWSWPFEVFRLQMPGDDSRQTESCEPAPNQAPPSEAPRCDCFCVTNPESA